MLPECVVLLFGNKKIPKERINDAYVGILDLLYPLEHHEPTLNYGFAGLELEGLK